MKMIKWEELKPSIAGELEEMTPEIKILSGLGDIILSYLSEGVIKEYRGIKESIIVRRLYIKSINGNTTENYVIDGKINLIGEVPEWVYRMEKGEYRLAYSSKEVMFIYDGFYIFHLARPFKIEKTEGFV